MGKSLMLLAILYLIVLSSKAKAQSLDVKTLEISDTKNAELLSKIEHFKSLEKLSIVCLEDLKELPESIGELKKLKELNMDNGNGCSMNAKLPESIGNLSELQILNLAGAQYTGIIGKKTKLPRHPLPQSLSNLKKLETLNLSKNGFSEIPTIVSKIPNLKHLALNFNYFENLPDWLIKSSIVEISLGDNCKITGNNQKQNELSKRFPKIRFDFSNQYDCE